MAKSSYSNSTGRTCNRCGLFGSKGNAVRLSPWWNPNAETYKHLCEDCIEVVNAEIGRGMY